VGDCGVHVRERERERWQQDVLVQDRGGVLSQFVRRRGVYIMSLLCGV
jgi:hypothetical protein